MPNDIPLPRLQASLLAFFLQLPLPLAFTLTSAFGLTLPYIIQIIIGYLVPTAILEPFHHPCHLPLVDILSAILLLEQSHVPPQPTPFALTLQGKQSSKDMNLLPRPVVTGWKRHIILVFVSEETSDSLFDCDNIDHLVRYFDRRVQSRRSDHCLLGLLPAFLRDKWVKRCLQAGKFSFPLPFGFFEPILVPLFL